MKKYREPHVLNMNEREWPSILFTNVWNENQTSVAMEPQKKKK